MAINSRQKGKRGERAFRDVLREAGYLKARRGQQYSGEQGNPDVICEDIPGIHWEVKLCQCSKPYAWIDQASHDTGYFEGASWPYKIPVIAHKQNGKQWIAMLPMECLLEIIRRSDLPQ